MSVCDPKIESNVQEVLGDTLVNGKQGEPQTVMLIWHLQMDRKNKEDYVGKALNFSAILRKFQSG